MPSRADVDRCPGPVEESDGAERDFDRLAECQCDLLRGRIEHGTGLRVTGEQLGMSRDATDPDERGQRQAGSTRAYGSTEAAHGSTVAGSSMSASTVDDAPRPVTNSDPTTAAPRASAALMAIRCSNSGARPASS